MSLLLKEELTEKGMERNEGVKLAINNSSWESETMNAS